MNNIGVIGGADGTTQIVVSGSIGGPILWIFFGALALMVILYAAFYRRGQGQGGLPCPRGGFLRGGGSGRQIPRREHNVARRIGAAAAAAVTAHARAQLRRGVVELFGRTVAAHRADGGGPCAPSHGCSSRSCAIRWASGRLRSSSAAASAISLTACASDTSLTCWTRCSWTPPVFNVADVFVVCGTVCALIYYLAFYSKSDEKNWGNKSMEPILLQTSEAVAGTRLERLPRPRN